MAAIYFYSLEDIEFYRPLNSVLNAHDRKRATPFFPYIKLLTTALYKLPPYKTVGGTTLLYRGMGMTSEIQACYIKHKRFTWWGFTSTSKSEKVGIKFATSGSKRPHTLGGVVFRIKCETGRLVKQYSKFQTEDEVLLEPGMTFVVENVEQVSKQNYLQKLFGFSKNLWRIDIKHLSS